MSIKDKENLQALGYKLLKSDDKHSIYVFENKLGLNFSISDMAYILSDTLTF